MIRIGIVGTGGMANTHAEQFAAILGCRVTAVCDIDKARVQQFAAKHGADEVYTDVDAFLKSAPVDAVSVVTPDAFHAPISLKALAAGKHVLCEKPLAVNYGDAAAMAQAATAAGVINMVNFSYRNAASIHKAHEIVASGDIGRLIHIEACYLQAWLGSTYWGNWRDGGGFLWRLSKSHGSLGVLGDVGVHIVDFATYPAGKVKSVQCRLKAFTDIKGAEYGGYTLDANDSALITAEMQCGALASITTTRWAVGQSNTVQLRLYGECGGIRINLEQSETMLEVCRGENVATNSWETIDCVATPNIYQRFADSIQFGVNDQPDFARGAEIQKILAACFESDRTGCSVEV